MRTPRSSAAIPSRKCGALSTGTSRSWPAGPRSGSDVAPRHVVLVGLPGSGKTTVGTLAAGELGAPFTDLDVVIAARAGKSVGAIFAEQGEPAFRALEASVGTELLAGPPLILAPGGGFFADAKLRAQT